MRHCMEWTPQERKIPIEYRYDNDVYHLLLIVSTFVLYKAIAGGDWKHPQG